MNIYNMLKMGLPALILTGCAAAPVQKAADIERINQRYDVLASDSSIKDNAAIALQQARESVATLNNLVKSGAKDQKVSHQVYLSDKRLSIVEETARMKDADDYIENADLHRKEVLLQASRADQYKKSAELQHQKQLLAQSRQETKQAKAYAQNMREKAIELEQQVTNLNTKETERGLVMTLSDILFELDSDTLKSGAERSLDKVAQLLQEYPEREIVVEGFTDSQGSDEYNRKLSKERATAVKQHLVSQGIEDERVDARGYGEMYPVASNDTLAGRQQNRRVEIVVANESNQPVSERQR